MDLGEGFLQGAEPTALAQPGPLKVPETIFAECFDHSVDLWRAGCTVGLTNLLEDCQHLLYKLKRRFNERVHDQTHLPLLLVIEWLMRFQPSSRITASHTLDFLRSEG
ncbi:hypothetical protein V1527DRAFT_59169 [Lipomyces starkeyi]